MSPLVTGNNGDDGGDAAQAASSERLIACEDLVLGYGLGNRFTEIVHGARFEVTRGRTTALVGESGSGKSTLAKALVRLLPVHSGKIIYDGSDVTNLPPKAFLPYRRRLQFIFQDPWHALNPRLTVRDLLMEPLRIHFPTLAQDDRSRRIKDLLNAVHLPSDCLNRFPHAFSGGQRQRILIARALAVEPECLICDEPLSALDVSTQARLLDLFAELRASRALTLLFISHDLAVVQQIADHVMVMEKGLLVEQQAVADLFSSPKAAYTRRLLEACPKA
jgi:ABC-type glutathione transport system ATPase component